MSANDMSTHVERPQLLEVRPDLIIARDRILSTFCANRGLTFSKKNGGRFAEDDPLCPNIAGPCRVILTHSLTNGSAHEPLRAGHEASRDGAKFGNPKWRGRVRDASLGAGRMGPAVPLGAVRHVFQSVLLLQASQVLQSWPGIKKTEIWRTHTVS